MLKPSCEVFIQKNLLKTEKMEITEKTENFTNENKELSEISKSERFLRKMIIHEENLENFSKVFMNTSFHALFP